MQCESAPDANVSDQDKFFQGNHLLESIDALSSNNIYSSNTSKNIYLTIESNSNAHFIFKSNSGEYLAAALPYDKMRFQFIPEESTEQPYCKFRWMPYPMFTSTNWQTYVVYYVIAVKKSQIQQK
jgi:hypothetical protein